MLETALPLSLFPRLQRNFGNGYELGVIPSDISAVSRNEIQRQEKRTYAKKLRIGRTLIGLLE